MPDRLSVCTALSVAVPEALGLPLRLQLRLVLGVRLGVADRETVQLPVLVGATVAVMLGVQEGEREGLPLPLWEADGVQEALQVAVVAEREAVRVREGVQELRVAEAVGGEGEGDAVDDRLRLGLLLSDADDDSDLLKVGVQLQL